MHQLVPLLVVVASARTTGQPPPPYSPSGPPGGLQPPYRGTPLYPPEFGPPLPPGASKPFFTFAEVNTPYYHYHYYAPVYKNHLGQPTFSEHPSPEPPFRNEVNHFNNHRSPSGPQNLFYPAATKNPLGDPPKQFFQNECTPPYCDPRDRQRPSVYSDLQGVPIQSLEPHFRNQPRPYAPSFTSHQNVPTNRFPLLPPQGKPTAIPSDLATSSPNIIREDFKENPVSQNILKDTPFGPSTTQRTPFYPSVDRPYQTNIPLFVPESFATTSSTIVKDEIRRGVMFKPNPSQIRNTSVIPFIERSSIKPETFPTMPSSTFNIAPDVSISPSDSSKDEDEEDAKITYIPFPQNSRPQIPSRSSTVRSIVLSTDIVVEDSDSENSDRSLFYKNLDSSSAELHKINATSTHTQKIAPKTHPNEDLKKHIFKHPNVLFDAPGHDSPD